MRSHLVDIRARRTALRLDAAFQREELDALVGKGDVVTGWVAVARRGLDELKKRPLLVGAFAAGLFLVKPKRFLSLASSAWWLWRTYARLKREFA
jgi:hypothetical protein